MKISSSVPVEKISNVQKIDLQVQEKENKNKKNNIDDVKDKKESLAFIQADISKTVDSVNDFIKPINTSIHFRLHDELNRYYVELVDKDTNEVIKEIPSEQWLDLYANMLESIGLIVDRKI